ncbi:MAG: hypothetical protein ACI91F_002073, partial [Candidatus Binatia bacterium]
MFFVASRMADALFERDTKDPTLFHPTELTRGP